MSHAVESLERCFPSRVFLGQLRPDAECAVHRVMTPITDKAVLETGSLFGIGSLLQHVARARRQFKLAPGSQPDSKS